MKHQTANDSLEAARRRAALSSDLLAVAGGDRAAFARLYADTSEKVFRTCFLVLGTRSEAEEVTQEVYLKVWSRATDFDPSRGSPVSWLCTIARNQAIDRHRVRPTKPNEPLEMALHVSDGCPSAEQRLEHLQTIDRMMVSLGHLGEDCREAITEAFLLGKTHERLAEALSLPLGTVKARIRRSLVRLRRLLNESEAQA